MAYSIFKAISFLETQVADGGVVGVTADAISALVRFIEEGRFTDSDVERYICKHFRDSSVDMTIKWNNSHINAEKSKDTFRCQVSSVNRYLERLLGISGDELIDAAFCGKKTVFQSLLDFIEVFDSGDDMARRFASLGIDEAASGTYSADECADELAFLKSVDSRHIDALKDSVDHDRLVYTLGVLCQPLVQDEYVNVDGRKRKIKTAKVNREKVDFVKAYNAVDPMTSTSVFDLNLPKNFEDIFLRVLSKFDSMEDERRVVMQSKATDETREAVRDFLSIFTEAGFRQHMKRLNGYDLVEELRGHLKVSGV